MPSPDVIWSPCAYIWTAQRTKSPWLLSFLLFIFYIIYLFGLHWVLVAVHGLSLVAVSGGHSLEPEWPASGKFITTGPQGSSLALILKLEETETHGGQMTFAQSQTPMHGSARVPAILAEQSGS